MYFFLSFSSLPPSHFLSFFLISLSSSSLQTYYLTQEDGRNIYIVALDQADISEEG